MQTQKPTQPLTHCNHHDPFIKGYQDAVHNAINITAYDASFLYKQGFEAGCEDMRMGATLKGKVVNESEW